MRPYRKGLIAAGLRESQTLVRDMEGDPRAESQLIDAYLSLSSVEREGVNTHWRCSRPGRRWRVAEKRLAKEPSSVLYQEKQARAFHCISTSGGSAEECLAAAQALDELYRRLCASPAVGDRRGWTVQIRGNRFNTGNSLTSMNRIPAAIEAFLEARAACDELEHMGDRSPETRDLMARNLLYLCRLYHGTQHFDESIATGTRRGDFRQLVADHPDQFSFAHQLFLAHAELGLSHLSADRPEEAIAAYEGDRRTLKVMIATFGRLVREWPRFKIGWRKPTITLWTCTTQTSFGTSIRAEAS